MNTIPVRPLFALKLATLAVLAFLLLFLTGCRWAGVKGNGNITTENRQIADFTNFEADGAFDVKWTKGPARLSIRTDENLMEHIRTDVSGQTLHLEWSKPLRGTRGIKVEISSPSISRIQLNGAVKFAGSNISGTELYLEANGATRIGLDGTVNALSAELNGASRLDAQSLITRAMELGINGAGRAEVHVTQVLRAEISGAGKVIYSGDPKSVSRNVSGAGSIKKRD